MDGQEKTDAASASARRTIEWLLDSDSDPAIRWQTLRDLTDAAPAAVAAERACIPREGLGAKILAWQGADGSWHRPGAHDWLINLFTMQLLRATGADAADPAVETAAARLDAGFHWPEEFGAYPFFEGEVEPCINGGVLSLGSYFGRPSERLAQRLVSEQLEDGGWNCEAPKSKRSSYHTTICVLEGLLEYERAASSVSESAAAGRVGEITAARRRGQEYLLARSLFRRVSTGEVASADLLKFAYPPRYCYDVLRALDYFCAASAHDKARPDARMAEAVQIVESKRRVDGRWQLDDTHNEALAFAFTETVGEPSRWNTLRALRVLRWYAGRATKAGAPS